MSRRRPEFGSQQLSRGVYQAPADWNSSSIALPVDSLTDEPLGRCCWALFAFCRPAVVPSALSSEGVRESSYSTRKAVHYLPPSSRANRCWQNCSHITRRTEEGITRGSERSRADCSRHTSLQEREVRRTFVRGRGVGGIGSTGSQVSMRRSGACHPHLHSRQQASF
jgi:hypothetical protein